MLYQLMVVFGLYLDLNMTSQQQYAPPYGQTYPQYPQQQQQQFIVFNPNQRQDVITRPPVKVKYSDKNIKSVRG